jgi:hypothetical protein
MKPSEAFHTIADGFADNVRVRHDRPRRPMRKRKALAIVGIVLLVSTLALPVVAAFAKTGKWKLSGQNSTGQYVWDFIDDETGKSVKQVKSGTADVSSVATKTPDGYTDGTTKHDSKDNDKLKEEEEDAQTADYNGVLDFLISSILRPFYNAAAKSEADAFKRDVDIATSGMSDLTKSLPRAGKTGRFTTANKGGANMPMHELIGYTMIVYDSIKPIGATILAILCAVQLVRLIRPPESGPNTPYMEQFIWLFIQFALMKVMFDNSMDITAALFNSIADVTSKVAGTPEAFNASGIYDALVKFGEAHTGIGDVFVLVIIVGLVGVVLSWIMNAVVYVASYLRWFQLFVYLPFAPLAFGCLGLDESRHFFWGYLRSIMGAALGFLITVIILKSLPSVFTSTFATWSQGDVSDLSFANVLGIQIMYIYALTHAGSWAHEIIGG